MNDKDPKLTSEVLLHENSPLTPYDTFDNEYIHPTASKRTLISSTGERKHIYSPSQELPEEASNLAAKRTVKDSSRISDLGINYDIDVTSPYVLQITLKNMKERYQKLQKKLSVLEEENGRLINGKSDLFSEIGKMQESSIKLREKNLQLNHEVHSKHQECCSLQEKFSTVSNENLKLTSQLTQAGNEKKKLTKEMDELKKENTLLREGMEEILSQCKRYCSTQPEIVAPIERTANRSLKRNPIELLRIKIMPQEEDLENLGDFEMISALSEEMASVGSLSLDESKDGDQVALEVCLKAKDALRKMASFLRLQNQELHQIKPLVLKRNRHPSGGIDSDDQCKKFLSRLATCGSGRLPSSGAILSSEDPSGILNDSGGETNVLVEEVEVRGKRAPFDWRKVEVSDDDAPLEESSPRPETRTVSTSPDLTLTFDLNSRPLSSDEDRTCPMCNAVFPLILSQDTFESHVVSHFEADSDYVVVS